MKKIAMANPSLIYNRWETEHIEAVKRSMESGSYIGGVSIYQFISELAEYLLIDKSNIVTCANGSDALLIAYQSIGLEAGDEIIMPSLNYIASAESAIRLGLVPVFADTSKEMEYLYSISFDYSYLDSLISNKTKAIVAVNLYGIPANIVALKEYAESRNLILIEDNAQGFGGYIEQNGKKTFTSVYADISTCSFFPTKPLGAMGDGGMIISKNTEWIEKARSIANHGQSSKKYDYHRIGMNSRLDAIQAEILRVRLRHIEEIIDSYNNIADIYSKSLDNCKDIVYKPIVAKGNRATFYQYVVLLKNNQLRNEAISYFNTKGIASQLYYPQNLDQIDILIDKSIKRDSLSLSRDINERMLSLPIYPFMNLNDQEYIIDTLKSIIN